MKDKYEPSNREKHNAIFDLTWQPRVGIDGPISIVGSWVVNGDLYQKLEKDPTIYIREMTVGEDCEPIIPEAASKAQLKIKQRNNPVHFAQSYQGKRLSAESVIVPSVCYYDGDDEKLRSILEAPGSVLGRTVLIAVDPGGLGQTSASDYAGISRIVLYEHRLYVTWMKRERNTVEKWEVYIEGIAKDPSEGMDLMLVELVGQAAPHMLRFYRDNAYIGGAGKFRQFKDPVLSKAADRKS